MSNVSNDIVSSSIAVSIMVTAPLLSQSTELFWDPEFEHASVSSSHDEDDDESVQSWSLEDERFCNDHLLSNSADVKLLEIKRINHRKALRYGEALQKNKRIETLVIHKGDLVLADHQMSLVPLLEFIRTSLSLRYLALSKLQNEALADLFLQAVAQTKSIQKILLKCIPIRFESMATLFATISANILMIYEPSRLIGGDNHRAALELAVCQNASFQSVFLRGIDDTNNLKLLIEVWAFSKTLKEIFLENNFTPIESIAHLVGKTKSLETLHLRSTTLDFGTGVDEAMRHPVSEAFQNNISLKNLSFLCVDLQTSTSRIFLDSVLQSSRVEEIGFENCTFHDFSSLRACLLRTESTIESLDIVHCYADPFPLLMDVIKLGTSKLRKAAISWQSDASHADAFLSELQYNSTLTSLTLVDISQMSDFKILCVYLPKIQGLASLTFSMDEDLLQEVEELQETQHSEVEDEMEVEAFNDIDADQLGEHEAPENESEAPFDLTDEIITALRQNCSLTKMVIEGAEHYDYDDDEVYISVKLLNCQRNMNILCKRNESIQKWIENPITLSSKHFAQVVKSSLAYTDYKYDVIFRLVLGSTVDRSTNVTDE